eukprot:c18361_g1_i4.p1 GENE.c18361_g1_i4~~c18361_g1_i4.p1  ORF type:complete len:526 (+),score=180.09 c18361_g1_i4:69-1646(+)
MFLTRYVRLNGILFTRTSLEKFDSICTPCLSDIGSLIDSGELTSSLLLQIVACNIFIVHDSLPPTGQELDLTNLTMVGSYALGLAFDTIVQIIRSALSSGDFLLRLLPTIAIFLSWCQLHPSLLKHREEFLKCFWDIVCNLINSVRQVVLSPEIKGTEITREAAELRGFIYLQKNHKEIEEDIAAGAVWSSEPRPTDNDAFESSVVIVRNLAQWAVLNKILFSDESGNHSTQPIPKTVSGGPKVLVLDLTKQATPPTATATATTATTTSTTTTITENIETLGIDKAKNEDQSSSSQDSNKIIGEDSDSIPKIDQNQPTTTNFLTNQDTDLKEEKPNGPQFAMQVVTKGTQQRSDLRLRLINDTTQTVKPLIVIDSANVAMRHGKQNKFSCAGLKICVDYWQRQGHKVIAFLPEYFLDYERAGKQESAKELDFNVRAVKLPTDIGLLRSLYQSGVIVATPGRDYDDSYCIEYARRHGGYVVTNDQYRDQKQTLKEFISKHCISYTFVGDEFLPNPDFRFQPTNEKN